MFDGTLRKWFDPLLDRFASWLAKLGLRADLITLMGFMLGVGAWIALTMQAYLWALVGISANRIFDGLDGAVAKRLGPTDRGAFLDIVFDFLFYSGVVFFFAVGRPECALPAAFLIFSFVGTGASFLAFATLAAKRGITTEAKGKKSIYYLGGLTEGAETIALFVLLCLFPDWFATAAWIFGAMCWLTTLTRIIQGYETLGESK